MKTLLRSSITLLVLVFSCDTDSDTDFEITPEFSYDMSQQYTTLESFVIDFESFNAGDIVSEIFITDPFDNAQVTGITMAFPDDNAAMIFDSGDPTGGDFDLGTPNEIYGGPGIGNGGASNDIALGNVLILSEDLDSSDPDDIYEIGARFVFDFSTINNAILNNFDILDIEESNNPTVVNLYDNQANVLLSKVITPGGDNSKVNVDLEATANVVTMEILMNSSGAIDNIALQLETEAPCVTCDSNITSLSFIYNEQSESSVRIETTSGVVLYNSVVTLNDTFTINGDTAEGLFSGELVIFINDALITNIATDCTQIIGPGFVIGSLEIIAGTTATGGQLCPVEVAF